MNGWIPVAVLWVVLVVVVVWLIIDTDKPFK